MTVRPARRLACHTCSPETEPSCVSATAQPTNTGHAYRPPGEAHDATARNDTATTSIPAPPHGSTTNESRPTVPRELNRSRVMPQQQQQRDQQHQDPQNRSRPRHGSPNEVHHRNEQNHERKQNQKSHTRNIGPKPERNSVQFAHVHHQVNNVRQPFMNVRYALTTTASDPAGCRSRAATRHLRHKAEASDSSSPDTNNEANLGSGQPSRKEREEHRCSRRRSNSSKRHRDSKLIRQPDRTPSTPHERTGAQPQHTTAHQGTEASSASRTQPPSARAPQRSCWLLPSQPARRSRQP